jgi:hypothetical protein
MATSREQAPDFVRWLVEPETLHAAGCERTIEWMLPTDIWEVPEAETLRSMVASPPPGRRAALALALGYEFDPRRLRFEELGRRVVAAELLRLAGQDRLIFSPVLYQSRPRWDIYAPRLRALVIVNHLAAEKDVLGHLQHSNLNFVLWAPDPSERANPDRWYCLRYAALNPPDPTARNWFDETVRQTEQESLTRRRLTLELKNGEKDLPEVEAAVDSFRQSVRAALQNQAERLK